MFVFYLVGSRKTKLPTFFSTKEPNPIRKSLDMLCMRSPKEIVNITWYYSYTV